MEDALSALINVDFFDCGLLFDLNLEFNKNSKQNGECIPLGTTCENLPDKRVYQSILCSSQLPIRKYCPQRASRMFWKVRLLTSSDLDIWRCFLDYKLQLYMQRPTTTFVALRCRLQTTNYKTCEQRKSKMLARCLQVADYKLHFDMQRKTHILSVLRCLKPSNYKLQLLKQRLLSTHPAQFLSGIFV